MLLDELAGRNGPIANFQTLRPICHCLHFIVPAYILLFLYYLSSMQFKVPEDDVRNFAIVDCSLTLYFVDFI